MPTSPPANYAIGCLDALQGISPAQNSNSSSRPASYRYADPFETMPRAELPFYLHLMAHLARYGLRRSGVHRQPRQRNTSAASRASWELSPGAGYCPASIAHQGIGAMFCWTVTVEITFTVG